MRVNRLLSTGCLLFAILALSCGGSEPVPELSLVPGMALLHIHLEQGFNSQARTLAGEFFPEFELADSLLKAGPLGVSLVGVDITTLEPQLLMLSDRVTVEYATALAARQLDLDPRQEDNRVDLVSEQGYARAAVTERNGWTALYIGPAPHITLGQWLNMEKENSLAADTSLVKVLPENAQISVLLPGNLFGFLSLLPLERQIVWWQQYRDIAAKIKPGALAMGISWPDEPADNVTISLGLARREGGIISLVLKAENTGIDPDSAFTMILTLAEGVI